MMTRSTDFTGQIVIITGAARGIGYATAKRFSSAGATIAILDRDGPAAEKAAASLTSQGGSAFAWQADVTDERDVGRCIEEVAVKLGAPQILVNNAGIYPHIPFEQLDFKTWRHIVAVNLDSTFLCCRAVYPLMKAAGYGRIINFASAVILIGLQNVSAYAAAKAGVLGFSRVLASEAGPYGITVNVVSPGLVASEGVMTSREASFITGQMVNVDGGARYN
jgi:2-hydroxycyclohexanecarboxyl-CoA dehydrogenase